MSVIETKPLTVNCGSHGERNATVVCQHLLKPNRIPAGFVENSDDPSDLQAWCHACEASFQAEGGMSETFRAFNRMSIVCVACYAEAKENHSIQGH